MFYIIYETTNIVNNKKYRGAHITKILNDGYLGSGIIFKKAVKKYGKENFKHEILCECNSIDEMIEMEKKYVSQDWINNNDTYNLQTGGLNYGILSEKSKKKISNSIIKLHEDGRYTQSQFNRRGIPSRNKGKTGIFSEEVLQKIRDSKKGNIPWNKGKKGLQIPWNKGKKVGPMPDEQKEQISNTLKERFKVTEHHLKGKAPWNKGKKGVQESWNKGKKLNEIEGQTITCPHCNKSGDKSNMKRWHFDNCKHKFPRFDISKDIKTVEISMKLEK